MTYNPLPQPADVVVNTGVSTSPVSFSNPFPVTGSVTLPSTSSDAFGRLRVSNPLTLFDSSHRYRDNNLWSSLVVGTGSTVGFVTAQGLINIGIGTTAGCSVIRETTKVFAYQPGKALRNGEPVLTPRGWKAIEKLKVGDEVFDGLGNVTKVIGVYPQGEREIFRFTFDDGSVIDADEGHLWVTICRKNSKKFKKGDKNILTTEQMIQITGNVPKVQDRWRIPCSPILKIEETPVMIDPYTLGAILGDGSVSHGSSVTFTTADEELLDYLVCKKITKRQGPKYSYDLLGLYEHIRYYQLNNKNCFTKFVPNEYKFNSENVRLETLKGLMDTDGWVEKDGCTYFSSVSQQLSEDVAFLVRSLGGTAKIKRRESNFYYNKQGVKIECSDSYQVKICMPINPFKLSRKAKGWKCKWRTSFDRYVYSIQRLCKDKATCIRVESEDHTFIIRNNIVTHNSLLVLNTFVMNPKKTNLRQRVGYFGADNGMYFEVDGDTSYFVERSLSLGTTTRVAQEDWNVDKLDGTGLSGITLNPSKAEILWMDIEWLGVGTVRIGFVIDGKFIHCHSFHHANLIESTYITSGSLPLRYEIANTGITTSVSNLKQVCSTVISEGGYELRGIQQAIGIPITTPRTLTTAGTFYPIVSLRLKTSPNYLDAIVILTALSAMPIATGAYNWQIRASGTTTGGTWVSAGDDSAVNYNITGTSHTGGRILGSGFFSASNQGTTKIDILKEALFKFQLERNGLTSTPFEITLVVASNGNGDTVVASIDWEEVSR